MREDTTFYCCFDTMKKEGETCNPRKKKRSFVKFNVSLLKLDSCITYNFLGNFIICKQNHVIESLTTLAVNFASFLKVRD